MKMIISQNTGPICFCITLSCILHLIAGSQDLTPKEGNRSFDLHELLHPDDDYQALAEEWHEVLAGLADHPVGINSADIEILQELQLISRLQLNKLKEYRMIYGDLLSIYELGMVGGWDEKTISRVIPFVTISDDQALGIFHNMKKKSSKQQLILKTAFITEKRKGYLTDASDSSDNSGPVYMGSPLRLSLRYDLEIRNRIKAGLRMEKDPGEPYLVQSAMPVKGIKIPDHLSGFLQINRLGPVRQLIAGDYQISFGYGLNFSAGQYGSLSGSGPLSMSHRIRAQTSLSETGFLRGTALSFRIRRLDIYFFSSWQNVDGNSIDIDTATGSVRSFSSINEAGLHRTLNDLSKRKRINERVLGGMIIYRNNWLKTGIIAFQNQYNASVKINPGPDAAFNFTGRTNFIAGIASAIWLKRTQIFAEGSVSRNKGWACVSGASFSPSPGGLISLVCRNFSNDYQNWHGMGYISKSRNHNEKGIQASINLELPAKVKFITIADYSESHWFRYNLNFPTRQFLSVCSFEKNWKGDKTLIVSARYLKQTIKDQGGFHYISKPLQLGRWRFRIEGQYSVLQTVSMKSRIEVNVSSTEAFQSGSGWLLYHDISIFPQKHKLKLWLRICFFQVEDYEDRIYAYENDVLFDFSSFMFYGKGTRGILMISWGPVKWLDFWFRFSTVQYTNRTIGTGWDAIKGRRMNEIEFQVRIRDSFSKVFRA